MTRKNIVSAVETGEPFEILMADGRKYPVPHVDFIAIGATDCILYHEDQEGYTVLPYLTMTGINRPKTAKQSNA